MKTTKCNLYSDVFAMSSLPNEKLHSYSLVSDYFDAVVNYFSILSSYQDKAMLVLYGSSAQKYLLFHAVLGILV